ncbi:MAG: NUDIX hydrolase [Nitrospirae bacterium]|nr:NUDIX hydrolase [Nitrospirota bacterium]
MESKPKNPFLTVDAIIEIEGGIVLIKRKNPPPGWAIPGGFVDYGEPLEAAVCREAKEETGLDIRLVRQFHTYSAPGRDPRHHTVSTIFIAAASGRPEAGDDAKEAGIFTRETLPQEIAFDHRQILEDYFNRKY